MSFTARAQNEYNLNSRLYFEALFIHFQESKCYLLFLKLVQNLLAKYSVTLDK